MNKKLINTLLTLPVVFVLAACSTLNLRLPWANSPAATSPDPDPATAVENKLAVGILELEGTSNAVTAEQARAMLPLWQAVRALGPNNRASSLEMAGLYEQIKEQLSPQQVQAITAMNVATENMQALLQKYGVQMRPGMQAGQTAPRARSTQSAGNAQRNLPGGGMPGGGVPGGGMPGGGFPGGGMGGSQSGRSSAQGTPQPGASQNRGGFASNLNILFTDPLIKLLQERAGS